MYSGMVEFPSFNIFKSRLKIFLKDVLGVRQKLWTCDSVACVLQEFILNDFYLILWP